MFRQQQLKQKHFYYSLVLHIILLSILVMGFDFSTPMPVMENNSNIVNAMVMDSAPKTLSKRIPLPTPTPVKSQPKSEPKPEVVKPQSVPPKPLVKHEEMVQSIKEAIAISDKKQKKVKEDLIQKQLLADLKKQTETKKKVQQQKSIEADFAKEMKAIKAKALEERVAREKERLAGVEDAKMRGVVDKYKALILQAIGQHWLVPHNADKSLSAELLIRVAPGGMVLDVQVMKTSGDDALDRSARSAVFKASPLPVPTDTNEFEPFRQFVLKVKPENILETVNNG
jgi:colicin import membrane protein